MFKKRVTVFVALLAISLTLTGSGVDLRYTSKMKEKAPRSKESAIPRVNERFSIKAKLDVSDIPSFIDSIDQTPLDEVEINVRMGDHGIPGYSFDATFEDAQTPPNVLKMRTGKGGQARFVVHWAGDDEDHGDSSEQVTLKWNRKFLKVDISGKQSQGNRSTPVYLYDQVDALKTKIVEDDLRSAKLVEESLPIVCQISILDHIWTIPVADNKSVLRVKRSRDQLLGGWSSKGKGTAQLVPLDRSVSGTVAGPTTDNVVVTLYGEDQNRQVPLAGDGSFRFDQLPAGVFVARPSGLGLKFNPMEIQVDTRSGNVDSLVFIADQIISPLKGKRVNATYWCVWGGNESYEVDNKKIVTDGLPLDQIDKSYNVAISAFIQKDDKTYKLMRAIYSEEEIRGFNANLKARGCKSIVSFGGAGFNAQIINETQAADFASQVKTIIDNHNYEGLDIDLEGHVIINELIDPVIFGKTLKEIATHYRQGGMDFWLTAAPEWLYVTPMTENDTVFSLYRLFYKKMFEAAGVDTFTYVWPQTYNQNPAQGAVGPDGKTASPNLGMDKFTATLAWALCTQEGFAKNYNQWAQPPEAGQGVFIPPGKLVVGIPATEGAANQEMTFVMSPNLIQSSWNMMEQMGCPPAGFMNWSADFDAANITDGQLSPGYTHTPWATGKAIATVIKESASD